MKQSSISRKENVGKTYRIRFRTPAQKVAMSILGSVDIRDVHIKGNSLLNKFSTTSTFKTDSPKNAIEYEKDLREHLRNNDYELVAFQQVMEDES